MQINQYSNNPVFKNTFDFISSYNFSHEIKVRKKEVLLHYLKHRFKSKSINVSSALAIKIPKPHETNNIIDILPSLYMNIVILVFFRLIISTIFSSVNIKKELLRMTDKVFRTISNYEANLEYKLEDQCMVLTDTCNKIKFCELEIVEPDYLKEILISNKTGDFYNIRDSCDSAICQDQLIFVWEDEEIKKLDFIVYNTVLLVSDLKSNDEDGVDLREIMIDKYYMYLIQEVKRFFNISKTFHEMENSYIENPKKKQIQYDTKKNIFLFYGSSQIDI